MTPVNDSSGSLISSHLLKASLIRILAVCIVSCFMSFAIIISSFVFFYRYSTCPLGVTPRINETAATENVR